MSLASLQAGRPRTQAALCGLAALALTLLVFGPCLWLMTRYNPGTFQWDRAHSFLLQCEHPLRTDVEPAMVWRLLPPLLCHALGLKGCIPLLLPLVGVGLLTWYVARLLLTRLADLRFAFGGTLLLTTSSATLVPLHWLGMNDAWVWLSLLVAAFNRSRLALPLTCLLAPWVDERFIIGLPLALLVRHLDDTEPPSWRSLLGHLCFLLPYAGLRISGTLLGHAAGASGAFSDYIRNSFAATIPWIPLAWWMAFRLAWLPLVYAFQQKGRLLLLTSTGTLCLMALLAADLSRSAAILLPVLLLGLFHFAKQHPEKAPRYALNLALLNLAVPAAHIVYTKLTLISPLPLELWRLLH